MVSALANLAISFSAGVFAPLGAVCVLPLYPGFLAYLAGQMDNKKERKSFLTLGLLVTLGVIVSLFIVGLIFTKILQESLTNAISIISPIAFGILAIVSLFLIFNFDFSRFLPKYSSPVFKNPLLTSFIFGLFFGVIVLPCNPASLIVLFAISTSTTDFFLNLMNFTLFGVGMALPLLIFSIISDRGSNRVIRFLAEKKRTINLIAGLTMLGISLYYLIFVFRIFG